MHVRCVATSVVVTAVMFACCHSASAQYNAGFTWNRQADWVVMPGANNGKTNGNPVPDARGNPVWHYQYVTGTNGLNEPVEANRWYAQPPTQMEWRAYTAPGWAAKDYLYRPQITSNAILFSYLSTSNYYFRTPRVSWLNPLTTRAQVTIGGTFTLTLPSGSERGAITEVAIGKIAHDLGDQVSLIWSRTYTKPWDWNGWTNDDTVAPQGVSIDLGDQVFWTARKRGSYSSDQWLGFVDRFSITLVPRGSVICIR